MTSLRKLFSLLTLLLLGQVTVLATSKVYIENFSIAVGEEKEIAINLDTDATDIMRVEGYITMPAGLTVLDNGYGTNLRVTTDATRTKGYMGQYNPSDGFFRITDMFLTNPIAGTTGAIAYIKVKADETLADVATITLDNFISVNAAGEKTALGTQNTTVSLSGVVDNRPVFSIANTEITLGAGESSEVEFNLTNELNLTGISGEVILPTGIKAELVRASRTQDATIFNLNAKNQINIFSTTGFPGNDGTIFSLKLTADETFKADGTLQFANIVVTTAAAQRITPDAVSLTVKYADRDKEAAKAALEAEITKATELLGEDDKTVEPGKLLSDAIAAAQAVADNEAATTEELNAATEALKAAEEAYQAAKDAEAAAALAAAKAALQDEITKATELLGDDDKTVDPGKSLSDAIAAAQAVADKADATVEELNDATEALKDAEEAYQAAKETESDLEAAKAELAAEIQKATELLGDDDQTVDPGKWLKESIDVAQAVLDDPNATLEEVQNATEALKTVEDLYKDAKQEQAEIAAAKAELAAEIQKATELLGNTDTTTDPGKSLKEAIDAAQAVLDDPTAVLVEVVSAIENLKDAEETFKNTPTAIGTLHNNKSSNGEVYNLNGVRVNHQYRGIYIVNGKKVAK